MQEGNHSKSFKIKSFCHHCFGLIKKITFWLDDIWLEMGQVLISFFFLFPVETILNHQDFQTTWESVYSAVPSVPELDLVSQFSNVSTNNISATSTTIRTTSTTSNVPDLVYPVSAKVAKDPIFNYIVPKSSRYVILLERTSIMNINQRWTNIRRALYR